MPDSLTTNSPIIAAYRAATPGSAARAATAAELFPSGITHDSRYIEPYGLYMDHAKGPRKWDVDGRCYVDYFGGHGAMLLGHCHPEVMAAVHAQLDRGTHVPGFINAEGAPCAGAGPAPAEVNRQHDIACVVQGPDQRQDLLP